MAPPKASKKSKASPVDSSKKKSRKTVASLSEEVADLRAEVAELRGALEALSKGDLVLNSTTTQPAAVAAQTSVRPPVVKASPKEQIRTLLSRAFELALTPIPEDPDEAEELFMSFTMLMHSDRRGTPLLNQSLKNYTWRQFRKHAELYLNDEADPSSFVIHRSNPESIQPNDQRVKAFIRAKNRMPPPINFKRDVHDGGKWRIESSSL